jgi:hypothetical protein
LGVFGFGLAAHAFHHQVSYAAKIFLIVSGPGAPSSGNQFSL